MILFMLAHCPICGRRYAICPDPNQAAHWLMYDRGRPGDPMSHICGYGLLCLHGHPLDITATQAAKSNAGHWLPIPSAPWPPNQN